MDERRVDEVAKVPIEPGHFDCAIGPKESMQPILLGEIAVFPTRHEVGNGLPILKIGGHVGYGGLHA